MNPIRLITAGMFPLFLHLLKKHWIKSVQLHG